ncbi:MAG: hypothetical protein Q9191_002650 [Dirinaria sp. TL-2023a]
MTTLAIPDMPLLGDRADSSQALSHDSIPTNLEARAALAHKQFQRSGITETATYNHQHPASSTASTFEHPNMAQGKIPPTKPPPNGSLAPQQGNPKHGTALTDTPATTAPNSPKVVPRRQDSGSTPVSRARPTTLDIPGLTKSRVSPDGRIAQRDVGSKLVIVMVGLPARGKSYITKKIARYLNWLQHDTRIFNVGERRREATTGPLSRPTTARLRDMSTSLAAHRKSLKEALTQKETFPVPAHTTQIFVNGEKSIVTDTMLPPSAMTTSDSEVHLSTSPERARTAVAELPQNSGETSSTEPMDQSAQFFDPENAKASLLREKLAMATLDDLLDYILDQGGSVGIFDATNSTLGRRKLIVEKIRERAGPHLGVLFLESLCIDENLLESNMRLKLSGPDYKDQDPVVALADFKERVALYAKKYTPLGDYEEKNNMQYVQMIDVGRKVVSHQIRGFLAAQTVYYLLNFNLSPRQIWITRHGESLDNLSGKIGGDSDLSSTGLKYGQTLTRFIKHERNAWEALQQQKALSTHFPPRPGDTTPPNPEYSSGDSDSEKNFCVWTSMLKRSIQTAQYFDEEDFEVKQMRMLDELNAGAMEGLTYDEIKTKHRDEYEIRRQDKLHYRYPGAGGEGYLDIINRLRAVIVEVERMTDHVLLVGHRSVARVLLAYFKGLNRADVADLDVPLGMLYMLEPVGLSCCHVTSPTNIRPQKPYGVEFKAYRYNHATDWFDHVPDYQLRRAAFHTAF